MERLICFLIGYAFGNFPTGYILGKIYGVDITKKGSGNVGTTNVLRNLGAKAGAITMLGDFLKTFIPLFITSWLFRDKLDMRYLLTVYTGFGAVMGHNFPVSLGFHGGKGVACTAAMIIYSDPMLFLCCAAVFFVSIAATKYVSVGSILGGTCYFIANVLFIHFGRIMGWGGNEPLAPQYHMEFYVLVFVVAAMIVFQHRSNIKRLLSGTENKLSVGKRS
ncbi:MAG TPA: glycerol-3-phosphate 1-O-acyltransferase PlsY [Candidatus Avilachnospira avistercoris]|nr:glycerol-3-phosphate 1-O-acyltransferase PlsY [Candidatus Avilachnospira avistercoris]